MCSLFHRCRDRGWELFHEDKFEEAIAEWQAAADLDPKDGYILAALGDALSQLGQTEAAFGEWQKAIHLEPDYDVPYIRLADTLLEAGYIAKALATIRTAIRLCPASANLHIRLGHYLVTQADEDGDKAGWEEAAAAFQQAIDIEPASFYAHRHLARMQWLMGKKRKAIAIMKAAISVEPNDFQAHKQLAAYQTGRGDLRGLMQTVNAIYALPETGETNDFVADNQRGVKRLEIALYTGAGLAAILVGVWVWNRRRGR